MGPYARGAPGQKCDLLPSVHFRFIKKKKRSNRKKQLRPAEKNYVITTLPLQKAKGHIFFFDIHLLIVRVYNLFNYIAI
jgi:hypothetical protein